MKRGLDDEVIFTSEPVVFVLAYEAGVVAGVGCAAVVHYRVQRVPARQDHKQ